MSSVAVSVRRVGKTYPPPEAVTALHGIDLEIHAGETVAITGPSGSGKSTLLNVIGTLERPSRGVVRIEGVDASVMTDRELSGLRACRIGFVFQQFFLLEHLTVLENVASALVYRRMPSALRRQAASQALSRVGLSHRTRHRPANLSGGERQRAAIARAIAGQPHLLLADEPTGNLDTSTGRQIITLLAELADDDTTVIVITHDPVVAATMDRQVRLRDGVIVDDVRSS
jgi:putative ABC transport system ATP-binding protein